MNKGDMDIMAKAVAGVVKDYVDQAMGPVLERVAALESRQTPAIGGGMIDRNGCLILTLSDGRALELGNVVGKDGAPGDRGKKGDPGEAGPEGKQGLQGRPGVDGKDADPDVIRQLVADEVAKVELPEGLPGPQGEQGIAGEKGELGAPGADGKDGRDGADGRDGKDAEPELIADMVETALERAVASLPAPEKGEPGTEGPPGRDGVDGAPGAKGEPGPGFMAGEIRSGELYLLRDDGFEIGVGVVIGAEGQRGDKGDPGQCGEKGAPGEPGKDGIGLAGAMIDRDGELVVTLTDGTARSLGPIIGRDGAPGEKGLDGKDGRDGADGKDGTDGLSFADFQFDVDYDGERKAILKWSDAAGKTVTRDLVLPALIDRGVYKAGHSYERFDTVSFGGSVWIAQKDTGEKPGNGSADWRLAVKHGRDGRDGKDGERGLAGPEGRPGRDFVAGQT